MCVSSSSILQRKLGLNFQTWIIKDCPRELAKESVQISNWTKFLPRSMWINVCVKKITNQFLLQKSRLFCYKLCLLSMMCYFSLIGNISHIYFSDTLMINQLRKSIKINLIDIVNNILYLRNVFFFKYNYYQSTQRKKNSKSSGNICLYMF